MPISSAAIRLSYLLPCSALHAAAIVSRQCGVRIDAGELKRRWAKECEEFPPLAAFVHEMGERPIEGYSREKKIEAEKIAMLQWMIEVTPEEKAA